MRIANLAAASGLACCLTVVGILAASSAPARAEEWCGFKDKQGAQVHCGYSSLHKCKQLMDKKNGVCMPDPSFARTDGGHRNSARPA